MATSFAIDQIAAALRADFAERSITASVLVGEWETEKLHDAPQVVIGLDRFHIAPPGGTKFGGGGWFPVSDDGTQVARPMAARMQTFRVWVHATSAPGTAPGLRPEAARNAASALLDQTIRAVRGAHGAEPEWGDGDWLAEEQGRGVHGATAWFSFTVPIPVLDDTVAVNECTVLGAEVSLGIDGAVIHTESSATG